MRRDALTQQFRAAASQRPVDGVVKQHASQGEVLCRTGRYGEGADALEKTVRVIGGTPGR